MYDRDDDENIEYICGGDEREPVATQNVSEKEGDAPESEKLGEARQFEGPLRTADIREESIPDFGSERSVHEDDEDASHAVTMMAQKLVDHLQHGFQGCTAEQHDQSPHEHDEAVGGRHHGLGDVFNDVDFPSLCQRAE